MKSWQYLCIRIQVVLFLLLLHGSVRQGVDSCYIHVILRGIHVAYVYSCTMGLNKYLQYFVILHSFARREVEYLNMKVFIFCQICIKELSSALAVCYCQEALHVNKILGG